ncbi:MAG: DUF1566 domain-containing protein [Nitrospinae bacterium]|nr:DUF1566 domain-containing protein [Nitrospinota bacterium]
MHKNRKILLLISIFILTGFMHSAASEINVKESLRHTPIDLSKSGAKKIFRKYNFYDGHRNQGGSFENNFVDNADGTVSDLATGLMWQKGGSDEALTVNAGKGYVEKLNHDAFAGYSDWYIPTIEELSTIMEEKKYGRLHLDEVFSRKQTNSISSDTSGTLSYWFSHFVGGAIGWHYILGNYYVKAVRQIKE